MRSRFRFRIPYTSTDTPLASVVEAAAKAADRTPYQIAMIMSYFFDALADKVADGQMVSIPGFGAFGPWAVDPKSGGPQFCAPRFNAAEGFRNLVRVSCRPGQACNDQMRGYRAKHKGSPNKPTPSARTFTAMSGFRDRIIAQAKRNLEKYELDRVT